MIPTLYIQQDPASNTSTDALSTVTNTDTSSTMPNQAYIIKPMNTNRGDTNSHWLYHDVVSCDTDMKIHTINCDTVVCETNIFNSTMLHTVSHSHHLHLTKSIFPQDGDLNRVLPDKNHTFYAFDTLYVHEVDNSHIHIDNLINKPTDVNITQLDLLPISILILKHIQSIPNQKVLTA